MIFAHFPQLRLLPASVTAHVSQVEGGFEHSSLRPSVAITLEADAVALFVMLTSSVYGRFDRNGVLLLPHEAQRLRFIAWEDFDLATFEAELDVQGVNVASVRIEVHQRTKQKW